MRLIISFAALFLSVILLQLSSGGVGPLDALSGLALGFSKAEIGLLGSAHFLGFFIGCWWAPRLMGTIGHTRAFAAFTATGAMGLMAHMMLVDPLAWALMRVATGFCVAGCYTVIEAWLNARLTNETRGRAMGSYRIADMGASLAAQLLIGVLAPAAYISYNLLALICIAALLPLTLSTLRQPETPAAPRLNPRLAIRLSPLAVMGVIVAGLTAAAFRMVGPLYGEAVGLRADQIGFFLAAFVGGGAAAQYPVGWLADTFDRRSVLIGLSLAAIASCGITLAASGSGTAAVFLSAALFGATSFPVYSVSAAHAHDWAESHERVELSAALMFFFAVGAIASPLAASGLMARYGPGALFWLIAAGHAALILFGLARMRIRPARGPRTRYVWTPRTSFTIGRLTRPGRERRDRDTG
jgi:MFS family permease